MKTETLVDDLCFGEGPRWHDGRLWFSDFYDYAIKSVGTSGDLRIEYQLEEESSGLGWLPDGRLLAVAMPSLRLLVEEEGALVEYADLSEHSVYKCNDMVVDSSGRAWVGNFGFDMDAAVDEDGAENVLANPRTANLVRVDPDRSVHLAAPELRFPNGTVVTPDGKTLIVAETMGLCLTAFDIEADGSLVNRREWASTGACVPDGICLDENGHIWVANAMGAECVLFAEGGEIIERVETSQPCFACMLGGEDGRQLFLVTSQHADPEQAAISRSGRIETVRVAAGRAGLP